MQGHVPRSHKQKGNSCLGVVKRDYQALFVRKHFAKEINQGVACEKGNQA